MNNSSRFSFDVRVRSRYIQVFGRSWWWWGLAKEEKVCLGVVGVGRIGRRGGKGRVELGTKG